MSKSSEMEKKLEFTNMERLLAFYHDQGGVNMGMVRMIWLGVCLRIVFRFL